jgi:DNA-binding FadR family transcriptional regulator
MATAQEATASTIAPPDWTRRPANLARAVTAELVDRIVRGLHPPGTPLPAEPELCETFSVSRTVVREAVKILQEKGLVQVRQGFGTVVTPPTRWNMLDEFVLAAAIAEEDGLAILDDLVITRRLLEADMANVLARVADQEIVDCLLAQVDRMDELVDDPAVYEEHDRAFHDTVMQASGNRIARAVVRSLQSQAIHSAQYVGRTDRSLCVASNLGHRRICAAIAAHDPAGAAAAMFTHITDAWLIRRNGPANPLRLQR